MNQRVIRLRTGAWCGDREIKLMFPDIWEVVEVRGDPPKKLTKSEMKAALVRPIDD
jgi:hypothetical protein